MSAEPDRGREVLRHLVATIAYRGGKALRNAPAEFGAFTLGEGTRSAIQILAHISDLLEWSRRLAVGEKTWLPIAPTDWDAEVARFFDGLANLDATLADEAPLGFTVEQLIQGPITDIFTHIGQISLMRRRAGYPVRSEVMILSRIEAGRVGPDQAPPVREFD
jgi:hypothetical protein